MGEQRDRSPDPVRIHRSGSGWIIRYWPTGTPGLGERVSERQRTRRAADDRAAEIRRALDAHGGIVPRSGYTVGELATHWTPHDHTRLIGPANSGVIDLLRIANMGDGIHTPQLAEPTLNGTTLSELLAPGAAEALIDWLAGLAPTMDDLDAAHHYIRTANTGDEEPF
jgi:hypothetical protein